jgi:hypothetical protein
VVYAAFGAFASLYGRNRVHLSRVRMQVTVGLLLTAAVTSGVLVGLSSYRAWLAVPLAAALAAAVAVWSDLQDWHPPGPLFVVFAFTACASLPSSGRLVPVAALVAAASAGFAVLVGGIGGLLPRPVRAERQRLSRDLLRSGLIRTHVLRYGCAVTIAGAAATASGIGHPYWAMVSAVVPMAAPDLAGQLLRGAQRLVGTVIGLAVSAALLALPLRGWSLIVIIVALQVGAELFVGRNYALALVFVTPLALLLGEVVVRHSSRELLFERGVETLIGVAVAVAVTVLTLSGTGTVAAHQLAGTPTCEAHEVRLLAAVGEPVVREGVAEAVRVDVRMPASAVRRAIICRIALSVIGPTRPSQSAGEEAHRWGRRARR